MSSPSSPLCVDVRNHGAEIGLPPVSAQAGQRLLAEGRTTRGPRGFRSRAGVDAVLAKIDLWSVLLPPDRSR